MPNWPAGLRVRAGPSRGRFEGPLSQPKRLMDDWESNGRTAVSYTGCRSEAKFGVWVTSLASRCAVYEADYAKHDVSRLLLVGVSQAGRAPMNSEKSESSGRLVWNAVRKPLAMLLASLSAGVAMAADAAAQSGPDLPQSAPAPATIEILNWIMTDVDIRQFASLLELSQLGLRDLHKQSVTFFVPKDKYCTAKERIDLQGLNTRNAAREYIRNHVFLGAIQNLGGRPTRAFSWSEKGQSPFPDLATIDKEHPYEALLASGKSTTISIDGNVLRIGARAKVVNILYGQNGSVVYIDYCGPL